MPVSRSIHDVLAVNRGEIAVRIFRACTELGIRTTAIHSWEDRLSIHRYKADRAYQVGERGKPVEAYLDGGAIIELALKKGVDAIHPGYGFLSENADFAQAVLDAGLVWIGPPPQAMRALGDKVLARQVAHSVGVPTVPGTRHAVQSFAQAKAFTDQYGFPVLFKAAAGGGGRGMRVVREAGDLEGAYKTARSEAKASFGDDSVFLERFLHEPRHIEVQLLADEHGNRVHLFERDCSIQRRYQKVVEIAPAPNLSDSVREKLFEYALALAEATEYSSVGTVEFLVEERDDGSTEIYFIEVNTRIQVEHTITEMITGRDLVKAMIMVAQGSALSDPEIGITGQEALHIHGAAIQARVTTEDPNNGFAPDSGKISTYRSAAGFGIRLDTSTGGSGSVVVSHYDSLLVKVCAWGLDMQDASQRLTRSLAEFRVRGIKTNIPFLQNVTRHRAFLAGVTHTTWVDSTEELFVFAPRRDRANKALRSIGDIILNGPPGPNASKFSRPEPLLEPIAPRASEEDPAPSSAYEVFAKQGAQGLSKWLRDKDELLITDTTFRDAHQSLLATRVRTQDIANIAPYTRRALPQLFSYEMWGGATFDVCMRFLFEDPWARLDALRQALPGALLQMLLRGANAVGYKNYPDNVVRAFVREAAKGVDVFRLFDALNYLPNMELAMEEVAKAGKVVEASICYTGDVLDPHETKYTLAYYKSLAKELEKRGAHILNIKDMAGLLKPYSAKVLIEELRATTDL
ncbi:MAG: pyruvate carboxylase, partial [Myxococcota bacterium]